MLKFLSGCFHDYWLFVLLLLITIRSFTISMFIFIRSNRWTHEPQHRSRYLAHPRLCRHLGLHLSGTLDSDSPAQPHYFCSYNSTSALSRPGYVCFSEWMCKSSLVLRIKRIKRIWKVLANVSLLDFNSRISWTSQPGCPAQLKDRKIKIIWRGPGWLQRRCKIVSLSVF